MHLNLWLFSSFSTSILYSALMATAEGQGKNGKRKSELSDLEGAISDVRSSHVSYFKLEFHSFMLVCREWKTPFGVLDVTRSTQLLQVAKSSLSFTCSCCHLSPSLPWSFRMVLLWIPWWATHLECLQFESKFEVLWRSHFSSKISKKKGQRLLCIYSPTNLMQISTWLKFILTRTGLINHKLNKWGISFPLRVGIQERFSKTDRALEEVPTWPNVCLYLDYSSSDKDSSRLTNLWQSKRNCLLAR